MLTAYTTKGEVADERTDAAVKAFFQEHFGHFVGKHTTWLLMDEPSTAQITPRILNDVRNQLVRLHTFEIAAKPQKKDEDIFHQDLNKIVADLEDSPEGPKQKIGRKRKPKTINKSKLAAVKQGSSSVAGQREPEGKGVLGKRERVVVERRQMEEGDQMVL